jgi:hypothetical protein
VRDVYRRAGKAVRPPAVGLQKNITWLPAAGCRLLAAGCWRLSPATRCCLLPAGWLLAMPEAAVAAVAAVAVAATVVTRKGVVPPT